MTAKNYTAALAFVWGPGRDSPDDGYHTSAGDSGGGTLGGVIEATWQHAVLDGLVNGMLRDATRDQLSTVLRRKFWGTACDSLPAGIDFLLFNGRMMSGAFPKIFQSALGFVGDDVDGDIGPMTVGVALSAAPATLANALTGAHWRYLASLSEWTTFGAGWAARLLAARATALTLIHAATNGVTNA